MSACQTTGKPEIKAPEVCGATPLHFFDHVHNLMKSRNPSASHVDLNPEQVAVFLAAFNASPPQGKIEAENIRLYIKPGARTYFMVIYTGNCVKELGEVPVGVIRNWMAGKPLPAGVRQRPFDPKNRQV